MKVRNIQATLILTSAAVFTIACSGRTGPQGPEGPPGPIGPIGPEATGKSAISSISPLTVFLSRSATVTLSGSDTQWTSASRVDFGPGIRVTRTTVASTAALVAVIQVDGAAATGVRDVAVDDGTRREIFQGAFAVLAPAALQVMGSAAQGSLVVIRATNQDPSVPFDATAQTDVDGFATFPNFAVEQPAMADGGSGIYYSVYDVTPRVADIVATVDVRAPLGPQIVTLESGPTGSVVEVPSDPGYSIVARTPRELVDGVPATGSLPNAYSSELFAFSSPAGLNVVDLGIEASGPEAAGANAQFIRLPSSGRFADLVEIAPWSIYTTAGAADSGYLIAWDDSGAFGYPYTLSASVTPAVGVEQATELPTSLANAQPIALGDSPVIVERATLEDPADVRYFAITVEDRHLGRSLRVFTEAGPGGDAGMDVAVDLRDASDSSLFAEGPIDDDLFENVLTDPLTSAGTYYVVLTTGVGFEGAQRRFQVMLRFE